MSETSMPEPDLAEKIAFLSRPEAYKEMPAHVEVIETHMSCVFLTGGHAWKLKKPVLYDYLDFSTVEARKRDGEIEVMLNRRLAADVYLGIVPLVVDSRGKMMPVGSHGRIVDWLVQMRRLPEQRMLDAAIATHSVSREDIHGVTMLLTRFYRQATRIAITSEEYVRRLEAETAEYINDLLQPQYALPAEAIESIRKDQFNFLKLNPEMFHDRVRLGKIIDAHGDLRPEHICVGPPPAIIDCLEFNADFRILDPVSELAFLGLECDRLNAGWVGGLVLDTYRTETGDSPPEPLLLFYKKHHACIRAKIAVWHLRDPKVTDAVKWIDKAKLYLRLAQSIEEFHQRPAGVHAIDRGCDQ
jgi:aminoglycoside phosphotransferase family enzyme